MTKISMALSVFLAGVSTGVSQDAPAMPKPQKEHEWLQQLVGEWDTEAEMMMGPDQPVVKSKGAETGRMIGGFWALIETKGEIMGGPFTGILSLGYDPQKKKYIGTWLDSMTSYLWTYQGAVDATGKILTLETEGPGHEPGKLAKYREIIEIKNKDHKVFTSNMEKDGKWITFLTVNYKRKK